MPQGDEAFEAHIRSRKVNPPVILYKYTTVDTARVILSTGKLRSQSPLRYNDPFDSQWDTLWPLTTPEAREYEISLIEMALSDPGTWPVDADPRFRRAMEPMRAKVEAMPLHRRAGAIADLARKAAHTSTIPEPLVHRLQDIRRRMRLLCLCESDQSILMWSHYADQHRGVVLGFDSTALEQGLRRPLEQVTYTDNPPQLIDPQEWIRTTVFGLRDRPNPVGREREWALTKPTDWRYEKEWRFVWIAEPGTQGDYWDFAFPRDSLVELVTGCRTDQARVGRLLSLARAIRPDVRCFQSSVHPSRFELVKTENPGTRAAHSSQGPS